MEKQVHVSFYASLFRVFLKFREVAYSAEILGKCACVVYLYLYFFDPSDLLEQFSYASLAGADGVGRVTCRFDSLYLFRLEDFQAGVQFCYFLCFF